MKKFIKSISIVCLVFSFIACNEDEVVVTPPPAEQTIAGLVSSDPNYSTLLTALTRTGLATTLSGTGQFTVFAPNNAAFTTFFGTTQNVNTIDVDVLRRVLLNHVIGSEIKSAAIPAATYVSTLSPFSSAANSPTISMFVQRSGTSVFINGGTATTGVRVTTADVDASNGVMHLVNAVIAIPTVVAHVRANPDFDTLEAVVTSTTGTFGNQAAVLTALNGLATPFATTGSQGTLFAPNNAAFTAATTGTGFAVGATAAQVSRVLQYHVVGGNNRSSQLTNNQSIPTLTTSPVNNITVILGGGNVDIRDTANSLSRVFVADIQCSNGVIHGVNAVLRPTL